MTDRYSYIPFEGGKALGRGLEEDKGEFYPILWRVMKLDDGQCSLKKQMFDCESMGGG